MNLRQARKILFSSHLHYKWNTGKYKPFADADGCNVYPSWANIDKVARARKVFLRNKKRNKRRIKSLK